jgi:hypothetical protein
VVFRTTSVNVATVVQMFLVCWSPFYIFSILISFNTHNAVSERINFVLFLHFGIGNRLRLEDRGSIAGRGWGCDSSPRYQDQRWDPLNLLSTPPVRLLGMLVSSAQEYLYFILLNMYTFMTFSPYKLNFHIIFMWSLSIVDGEITFLFPTEYIHFVMVSRL